MTINKDFTIEKYLQKQFIGKQIKIFTNDNKHFNLEQGNNEYDVIITNITYCDDLSYDFSYFTLWFDFYGEQLCIDLKI